MNLLINLRDFEVKTNYFIDYLIDTRKGLYFNEDEFQNYLKERSFDFDNLDNYLLNTKSLISLIVNSNGKSHSNQFSNKAISFLSSHLRMNLKSLRDEDIYLCFQPFFYNPDKYRVNDSGFSFSIDEIHNYLTYLKQFHGIHTNGTDLVLDALNNHRSGRVLLEKEKKYYLRVLYNARGFYKRELKGWV